MAATSLLDRAMRSFDKIREIRRHLHAHPELSFQEHMTTNYIKQELEKLGIEPLSSGLETGCIGVIGKGDRAVLLRADIDALPIQEVNEVPYRSRTDGIMHACGHDVHTACLLGAMMVSKDLEEELDGQVVCLFQPGEEKLPGGASKVIASGVLESYKIISAFGQHVHPPLEAGNVGFCRGPYMASADMLEIIVHGKGGHGALPNEVIDPITISANILVQLQQLLSRRSDPLKPSVLSFGDVEVNGGSFNVIPNKVRIKGSFRNLDEQTREDGLKWLQKTVENTAENFGGKAELIITRGYPVLFNDPLVTENAMSVARSMLGEKHVHQLPQRMTSEDFAFIAGHYKSCFYRLGTGFEDSSKNFSVHTDRFDVNEACLPVGAACMAKLAMDALKR